MKRFLTILIALLSALLLTACAGSAPVRQSPIEIDGAYVYTIESHANRAGVDVVWINPPVKRAKEEPFRSRR